MGGRGDIPPDEAVAIGCARHATSILSCDTYPKHGRKRTDENSIGQAARKVKTSPLAIGICRVEYENGDLESAIPIIEIGDPLPVNVTRSIPLLSDVSISIIQMQGGVVAKSKVLGLIEGIPVEGKSLEVTMELSSAGKLAVSVNGGGLVTL